jgi:predicted HAD superfamily Cof-like phosphohydrolase
MAEENVEYLEACAAEDVTEIADAIGDMLYILIGTALEHGMQDYLERVFSEIHRSNMSKMGEDGRAIRREDGKILKGPNYFRPNVKQILES